MELSHYHRSGISMLPKKVYIAQTITRAQNYMILEHASYLRDHIIITPRTAERARGRLLLPSDIVFVDSPWSFSDNLLHSLIPCVSEWCYE
jgi:hypothetical protein